MTTSAPPGVHEFPTTGPIDVDVRVRSGDVTVTAAERRRDGSCPSAGRKRGLPRRGRADRGQLQDGRCAWRRRGPPVGSAPGAGRSA